MAKIMIVDDSDAMRVYIRTILIKAGHEIVNESKTGSEAISAYRIYRPDVVTMDINMPDMDGVTVLKNILKEYKDAKIIMISAYNQKAVILEALKSGAVNYVLKPLQTDKVIESVNKVLES